MFRRKRSSSNPPHTVRQPPTAAAQLAASQAFLATKPSNASLSAAAAAAALRSQTSSPQPVGQLQTRRMQRRGSISSVGSAPAGPGGLQRRESNGSMTERTFRSPSPSSAANRPQRPASSHGPYPQQGSDHAPPVPALPDRFTSPTSQTKKIRRPASVGPPERALSPSSQTPSNGGVNLDRGSAVRPPSRTSKKTSTLGTINEAEKAAKRASVNYSRPMSPQNAATSSPVVLQEKKGFTGPGSAQSADSPTKAPLPQPKKKKAANAIVDAPSSDLTRPSTASSDRPNNSGASTQADHVIKSAPDQDIKDMSAQRSEPKTSDSVPTKKKKKKVIRHASELQDGNEGSGTAYSSDTNSVLSEVHSSTDRPKSLTTRAVGVLAKQPSMVREDPEGEAKAEKKASGSQAAAQLTGLSTAGAPSANMLKPLSKSHTRGKSATSSSESQAGKSLNVKTAPRPVSLSPARAAHFSTQPANVTPDIVKHQPPARSVSPAKSAMKHSPSRAQSPAIDVSRKTATGEISDTAPGFSEDGSASAKARKKAVRVSFDEGSLNANSPLASVPTGLNSSPGSQKKAKGKSWLDLIRDKGPQDNRPELGSEPGNMTPTPKLPSFGSIRDESIQETPSSPLKNPTDSMEGVPAVEPSDTKVAAQATGASDTTTGQALSGRQAEDDLVGETQVDPPMSDAVAKAIHAPVEHISSSQSDREPSLGALTKDNTIPGVVPSIENDKEQIRSDAILPSIAVMPATPGNEDAGGPNGEWLGAPGSFPDVSATTTSDHDGSSANEVNVVQDNVHGKPPSPIISPASVGIAEPELESVAAQHDATTPHVGELAESQRARDSSPGIEEPEEHGDVYSDAAEDQSDAEGDGFGSINAIIESPSTPTFTAQHASTANEPTSQVAAYPSTNPSEADSKADWGSAQAYWSGLSRTQKQQLEAAATPSAAKTLQQNESTAEANSNSMVNKSKKTKQKQTTMPKSSSESKSQIGNDSVLTSPGNLGTSQTRRASLQPKPKETREAKSKRTRPVSAISMVDYGRTTTETAESTAGHAGPPPQSGRTAKKALTKPQLRRTTSDGSESDSSFKRARVSKVDDGAYKMKRSMRGPDPQAGSMRGNRTRSADPRATSPAGSTTRRPFSTVGASNGGIRLSMRDNLNDQTPARRSTQYGSESSKDGRTKSPSRFGFSLGSRSKSVDRKGSAKAAAQPSSRFADSSDEEDAIPAFASSRFMDSSDEEEGSALRPVRGLPKRGDEGDSTDLDDSSNENAKATISGKSNSTTLTTPSARSTRPGGPVTLGESSGNGTNNVMTSPGTGLGLELPDTAEKRRKKRSFFGNLGSRRKDEHSRVRNTSSEKHVPPALQPSAAFSPLPDVGRMNLHSASTSQGTNTPTTPKSPKLQRRNTPRRTVSASYTSWPLTPTESPSAAAIETPITRPQTSEGNAPHTPTSLLASRGAKLQESPFSGAGSVGTGQSSLRKKRFPMLRKAFGLHA